MLLATPLLVIALLAPGAATQPHGMRADACDLRLQCDAGLETLRAGKFEPPASLREDDRAALRAAEARSQGLEDMRAGGVIGVLTIVVLVLLILFLI